MPTVKCASKYGTWFNNIQFLVDLFYQLKLGLESFSCLPDPNATNNWILFTQKKKHLQWQTGMIFIRVHLKWKWKTKSRNDLKWLHLAWNSTSENDDGFSALNGIIKAANGSRAETEKKFKLVVTFMSNCLEAKSISIAS